MHRQKPSLTLAERLEQLPFLRMLVPLVSGIVVADYLSIPTPFLLAMLAVGIGAWFVFRGERMRQTIVALLLLGVGVSCAEVLTPREAMPRNQRLVVSGTICDNINTRGRWHRTTADITQFRLYDDSAAVWQPCFENISLYIDTAYTVQLGERFSAVVYINPLDTTGGTSGYARTMRSRGVLGRAYVIDGRLIMVEPGTPGTGWGYIIQASKRVQAAIVRRLTAFGMDERELGVAMALLAGDRTLLDPEVREDYSKAGVSHILAISGLHLGIIFLLLNYLFTPLLFFRRGRTVRTILVILALWSYAFVSGMSASVLRAAFMLTVMQFSLFSVWNYNSYNALFGSAFILLLIRPTFLYDISFQMSYLALLGILFFYPRFHRWTGVERATIVLRRWRGRTKGVLRLPAAFLCNLFVFMTGAILIGLSAQIGVMPLVGWAFGRLPLLSVLANPLIMLVITWLMVAGFCYLMLAAVPGLGWLAGVILRWLLERQNAWVEWIAAWPGTFIENVTLSTPVIFVIYTGLCGVMALVKYLEGREHRSEPADVQPFA